MGVINLYDLVGRNEIEEVKRYISSGGDIHIDNGKALAYASIEGHYDMVELLLLNGINVNATRDIYSALNWAVICNHIDVLKLLIKHGANVCPPNEEPPIILACKNDNWIELTEILLNSGADINAVDFHNKTALEYAFNYLSLEKVSVLIDKGALIKFDDLSWMEKAIRYKIFYLVNIYIKYCNKNYQILENALNFAIKYDSYEIFSNILDFGIDINQYDSSGDTLLILAIRYNAEQVIRFILANGGEIDKPTEKTKDTPLMIAVKEENISIIQLLLSRGANPDTCNLYGWNSFSVCESLEIEDLLQEYVQEE